MSDITREEIERWRRAYAEMLSEDRDDAPGDFARLLAAAESSLDHPAALEAARAQERERCAQVATYRAQDLRAIITGPSKTEIARFPEFAYRADEADILAAGIRALGPAPAPAAPGHTDLMVPPESLGAFLAGTPLPVETGAPSALVPDLRERARETLRKWHRDSCYPEASPDELNIGLDAIFPAPPALPPDLRERAVKVLESLAHWSNQITSDVSIATSVCREAAALLSALREPPEWLPTHRLIDGTLLREVLRVPWLYSEANIETVVQTRDGKHHIIAAAKIDEHGTKLSATEARALMEAGRG